MPNINVGSAAYNPYTNWQGSAASHSHNNQFDIKIDHRFSDHDLFSAKYSEDQNGSDPLNCFGNVADPCDFGPGTGSAHLVAINHTHTFSPTLLLTVAYGLTRGAAWSHGLFNEEKYKGVSPSATLGFPAYMDVSGIPQLPTIELSNYSAAGASDANLGNQPWSYLRQGQETHHLLGTLSWIRGQHDLKFGAEGRLHRDNFTQPGTPGGLFSYDFTGTSQFPVLRRWRFARELPYRCGRTRILGPIRDPKLCQHPKLSVWRLCSGQLEGEQEAHAEHRNALRRLHSANRALQPHELRCPPQSYRPSQLPDWELCTAARSSRIPIIGTPTKPIPTISARASVLHFSPWIS